MHRTVAYFLLLLGCLSTVMPATGHELTAAPAKRFTLVLDAGHGGKDPGCIGAFSKEKDIALKVTLEVGRLVTANCPDVRVVYTRKTDVFVNLYRRAQIANDAKADLFISIHVNALPKRRIAYGAETYTLGMARTDENLEVAKRENSVILIEDNYQERYAGFNPRSSESYIMFEFMQDQYMKQSVSLASRIQKQYVKTAGRKDKGVHQAGYLVLRETSMPSVLTELGFISTPSEERYLNSRKGISELARSIYLGFRSYKESQEKPDITPFANRAAETETRDQRDNKASQEETTPQTDEEKTTDPPTQEKVEGKTDEEKDRPVFKVQLFVTDRKLKAGHPQLKGVRPVQYYTEKGLYKYTYGETTDYEEAIKQKKAISPKFPDAFIVAFKDGQRMDLQQAIREAKQKP